MTIHLKRSEEEITDCCKKQFSELPPGDEVVIKKNKGNVRVDCPEYGWKNTVKRPDARES
jgi:hypothetical protein